MFPVIAWKTWTIVSTLLTVHRTFLTIYLTSTHKKSSIDPYISLDVWGDMERYVVSVTP